MDAIPSARSSRQPHWPSAEPANGSLIAVRLSRQGCAVRLPGFAADRDYIVRLPDPWPEFGAAYLPNPEVWRTGLRLPGIALAQHGLALPLVHPGTAWLITTMPRDVRVRRHADLHFACNFGTTPVTLSDEVISPAGSIIIGTRTLGPADVAVWRQPSD